ncbi:MAG: formylglycine-generating enzyme family protein [Deltaproteobacteria bacterium]|nr:MAG: formylglycine-generating enzyme family protein [Deltaproteobacteria bacterium]
MRDPPRSGVRPGRRVAGRFRRGEPPGRTVGVADASAAARRFPDRTLRGHVRRVHRVARQLAARRAGATRAQASLAAWSDRAPARCQPWLDARLAADHAGVCRSVGTTDPLSRSDGSQAFAAWLVRTGRLPGARMCREEEWERAARGADGRIYTTGRQLLPSDANFDLTYGGTDLAFGPDEVGSHPASASVFGVEDLVGNASEMVETRRWNERTSMRAASWYRERIQQRLDNRFRSAPTARSIEMGFRLCADAVFR